MLMQFFGKIKKFRTYIFKDKLLIIKAFFITGIIRVILILVPFRKLKKYLGRFGDESVLNIDNEKNEQVQKISWVVTNISRYTPWESKCLVQALTAQRLLNKKGLESTLYLGVRKNLDKNAIEAHAWIRCGNIYITGGNGCEFSIVARYKK